MECDPDVRRLVPVPGDNLVVLGSDGLWDVMGDQEAVDCANSAVKVSAGHDVRVVHGFCTCRARGAGGSGMGRCKLPHGLGGECGWGGGALRCTLKQG